MISNTSPPRTAPLTTLNNSHFSRGARAVHQGQKKAKAYNISIAEPDCETMSGQSKDGGIDVTNGQLIRPLGETSPNQTCDSPALTPISKGILKRKREAEMEAEDGNGVSCSKKKVIFADPISATKLIESRKVNVKTTRKRRLRYEEPTENADAMKNDPQPEPQVQIVDKPSELEVTTNGDTAVGSPDAENSNPVVLEKLKQNKVDGKVRKIVKNGAALSSRDTGKSGKETDNTYQVAKGPTINSVPVLEKINEHSDASEEFVKTNANENPKDGNSDEVFSELESLLQAIESPCADKKSSNKVDPVVKYEVTESQTADNTIKGSLTDSNTKSDTMDPIRDLTGESPEDSSKTETEEKLGSDEKNSPPSPSVDEKELPTKEETEETKMDVDEEVNQPSTTKPLLESWVNVKKSVDLFIQSYCTMLTTRMRNWLNVKGINTIGDFANMVESSSDRLTESPICPLNEETIISTFQFMIEHKLNEESSSLEVREKVKDDDGRERGGMSEGATGKDRREQKDKKIEENDTISKSVKETQSKLQRLSTLKVIMPALPLELSSRINSDKPPTSDYLDAIKEVLPSTADTEFDCSGSTIELSEEEQEPIEAPNDPVEKCEKLSISTVEDASTKILSKKVPDRPEGIPIKKSIGKRLNPKKITKKKPAKSCATVKRFTEKSEPTLREEIQEEGIKESDISKEDSPKKDSDSSASKLAVTTSKTVELEMEYKPSNDPTSIVPRASIVIKRLTEDEIMQLSIPKITISMEICEEVASSEDKDNTQLPEPSIENKMIEEESVKVNNPPPSSSSPTTIVEDNGMKATLNIQDGSSEAVESTPLRKSRRKRDSELPLSKLLTPSTRTRRRTVSVKIG